MTDREEFEAWAKDNFLDVHRATDGGYFDALTSTTWFAWQACAALTNKQKETHMTDRMMPAHMTRLMTLAQYGQPVGYAGSAMMRDDLELLIRTTSGSHPTETAPIAFITVESDHTPPKPRPENNAFALELAERIRLLGLPEIKQKAAADVVFWALAEVPTCIPAIEKLKMADAPTEAELTQALYAWREARAITGPEFHRVLELYRVSTARNASSEEAGSMAGAMPDATDRPAAGNHDRASCDED